MLPKKNRVDRKGINLLFKEGKSIVSPIFTFKFKVYGTKAEPRVSVTAPKSVTKLAVSRNLLRRRGYNALGKQLSDLPSGLVGVLIFRKYEDDISKLEQDTKGIFSKVC